MKWFLIFLFLPHMVLADWPADARKASDAGVVALPVTALGVTYASSKSWEKTGLAAGAIGLNLASTFIAKQLVNSPRPDGSSNDGWPSGHTSTAFTSAGLICLQTDPLACGGALAAAAAVGALRIEGNRHTGAQVAAGVAFGVLHGVVFPSFTVSF